MYYVPSAVGCHRPWGGLHIGINRDVNVCCWLVGHENELGDWDNSYHANMREVRIDEPYLKSFLNNDGFRYLRRAHMGAERMPKTCTECMKTRGSQGLSELKMMPEKDFESAYDATEEDGSYDYREGIRRSVIAFANKCNLACRMCNPFASSKLRRIRDKKPNYEASYKGLDDACQDAENVVDNTEMALFAEDIIPMMYQHEWLGRTVLVGGEPLLCKETFTFLEKTTMPCHVVTNGTIGVESKLVKKILDRGNVVFSFSIDGIKEVNDFQRLGTDTDIVKKNIADFAKHARVEIVPVMSVITYPKLPEFIAELRGYYNDVGVSNVLFEEVTGKNEMKPQNISPEILRDVQTKLVAIRDELEGLDELTGIEENILNYINGAIKWYRPEVSTLKPDTNLIQLFKLQDEDVSTYC